MSAYPVQPTKYPDLIYDVGMHKGEDTNFYLKKGFRVVAFEADPDLVNECRHRFAAEIEARRLSVVEGAIVDRRTLDSGAKTLPFYRNIDVSVWGTVRPDWAQRNEALGTRTEIIEVPVSDLLDSLMKFGVPHYMKIDIEGADVSCLESLLDVDVRPDYVSIESEKVDFAKLVAEIELLSRLGYVGFKAVQQASISRQSAPLPDREGKRVMHRFEAGASGQFGEDLPGKWMNRTELLRTYGRIFGLYRRFGDRTFFARARTGTLMVRAFTKLTGVALPGWYDTHARHASCPGAGSK